jgi:hypothetical protein
LCRQLVDLALALDDAVGARIRNVKRQARRRQQMAGTRYAAPRRQRHAGGNIIGYRNVRQPLVEHARPARIVAAHLAAQAVRHSSGSTCRRIHGQRQDCRRRRGQRRAQYIGIGGQRRKALAQHGLDGRFPAAFDLDLLPQRLCVGKTARLQPFADLAATRHLGLQLHQRIVAGAGFGESAMCCLQGLACGAQSGLGRGYGRLQRGQAVLRHFQGFGAARFGLLRGRQQGRIGGAQACLSCSRRARRWARFSSARWAWPRSASARRSACSASLRARRASVTSRPRFAPRLRIPANARPLRRAARRRRQHGRGNFPARCSSVRRPRPAWFAAPTSAHVRRRAASGGLQAAARIAQMAELAFEAADFAAGGIHFGLRGMQGVGCRIVVLARMFDAGFDFAQLRGLGFDPGYRFLDLSRQALAVVAGIVALLQPEQALLARHFLVQAAILLRHRGLRLEVDDLVFKFVADVVDAGDVFTRILQPMSRFRAAVPCTW